MWIQGFNVWNGQREQLLSRWPGLSRGEGLAMDEDDKLWSKMLTFYLPLWVLVFKQLFLLKKKKEKSA